VSEQAALDAFAQFSAVWEKKYPAMVRLWTSAGPEMVPFLAFDAEIRKIVCTTNAIESINARSGVRSTPAAISRPSKPR
jgi:transposase-like protein